MSHRREELREAVERELRRLGARSVQFELTNGGHQRVKFVSPFDGRGMIYHFSGTPSDSRGLRNTVSGVRRMILASQPFV